ncbi:retrovirus-related pol polyprotein from transposon TNT 1-94 [Tanacetum coccineum]
MTTPITTSTTDSQMHNNIMAAGSRDRPLMLATGRYAQCQSRFLRYINTSPNGDALRKCILKGPYTPSTIIIPVVPATYDSPEVLTQTAIETILNMSPENKEHYQSEKEVIHLQLTRIGDEIYSTVDACRTAHDVWIAFKRLQQVNEIRAERIAKNANPLALLSTAQQYPDPYYQAPKSHKSYAPPSKQSSSTRSNASTKYKGKEIAKPITPPSESASKKDNDPIKAQRDKDMQKNLALIAKNKNVDTSLSQVMQQTRIQCFTCKEFGHFAKECMKPKRVKDYTYHKEKMLLCKQAEKGVPLQAEQADWLEDTNEEIDEQELEAHYSYMAKIQEVPTADSRTDTKPLEKVDNNVIPDSPDMCDNDIQTNQNAKECDDERAALANLIANLTLNTEENKKILKQLKKANASLTQELKE